MKRLFRSLTFALLITIGLSARLQSADVDQKLNQQRREFKKEINESVRLQYLLYLPEGYEAAKKNWPLLLFLHGAGERGNDLSRVAFHGPPMLVTASPRAKTNESDDDKTKRMESIDLVRKNFIVVSPQCPTGDWWHADELSALLDEIEAKYRVDKSRVYLTGLSMGGYGSWELGLTQPGRFAAIAPICGGGNSIVPLLNRYDPARAKAMQSLPIWAFHGGKDTTVVVNESERMIALLKRLGNKTAKLTVYPNAGHDSWTETYNNPEFYRWLLAQKRE